MNNTHWVIGARTAETAGRLIGVHPKHVPVLVTALEPNEYCRTVLNNEVKHLPLWQVRWAWPKPVTQPQEPGPLPPAGPPRPRRKPTDAERADRRHLRRTLGYRHLTICDQVLKTPPTRTERTERGEAEMAQHEADQDAGLRVVLAALRSGAMLVGVAKTCIDKLFGADSPDSHMS